MWGSRDHRQREMLLRGQVARELTRAGEGREMTEEHGGDCENIRRKRRRLHSSGALQQHR